MGWSVGVPILIHSCCRGRLQSDGTSRHTSCLFMSTSLTMARTILIYIISLGDAIPVLLRVTSVRHRVS